MHASGQDHQLAEEGGGLNLETRGVSRGIFMPRSALPEFLPGAGLGDGVLTEAFCDKSAVVLLKDRESELVVYSRAAPRPIDHALSLA
jgi:hypothetical protein